MPNQSDPMLPLGKRVAGPSSLNDSRIAYAGQMVLGCGLLLAIKILVFMAILALISA